MKVTKNRIVRRTIRIDTGNFMGIKRLKKQVSFSNAKISPHFQQKTDKSNKIVVIQGGNNNLSRTIKKETPQTNCGV